MGEFITQQATERRREGSEADPGRAPWPALTSEREVDGA